jgi:hypothetical protein
MLVLALSGKVLLMNSCRLAKDVLATVATCICSCEALVRQHDRRPTITGVEKHARAVRLNVPVRYAALRRAPTARILTAASCVSPMTRVSRSQQHGLRAVRLSRWRARGGDG